jgi:hypothetical protein
MIGPPLLQSGLTLGGMLVVVDASVVDINTDPLRLPRLDVAKDAPESFAFRLRQWLGSA